MSLLKYKCYVIVVYFGYYEEIEWYIYIILYFMCNLLKDDFT